MGYRLGQDDSIVLLEHFERLLLARIQRVDHDSTLGVDMFSGRN